MVNSLALDATFAALSDPTRRAILARLAGSESSVGELARPFAMSLPAVSKHLRVLEGAGLVARRREGRVHRLRLVAGPLTQAESWIERQRGFWEERLNALEAYLKETAGQEEEAWPQTSLRRRSGSLERSTRRGRKSSARGPGRKR
ncbi:MAG: metalloregulator ArsR/SmtB family transcription factor [Acidobacteriota bacterium]